MSSSTIDQSPSSERVWNLFKYCERAFKGAGVSIGFPKNTPPHKTYKWRYLTAFLRRVDEEWSVPDAVAYHIIDELVKLAVQRKLLHKGLALLHADKLILQACDKAQASSDVRAYAVKRIRQDHAFVAGASLLSRSRPQALPNIVEWYMRGDLSRTYLAISRRCHEAMMQLPQEERSILPDGKELINIRLQLEQDIPLKRRLRGILGTDMRSF